MKKITLIVFLIIMALVLLVVYNRQNQQKISRFGQYRGYSEPGYDIYVRSSAYLTLEDGTRLAYDLYLPANGDQPSEEALPTLFKYTPYLRTFTIFDKEGNFLLEKLYDLKWYEKTMLRIRYMTSDEGHLMDAVFNTEWLENMLHHGYAVVVVERPGTGASFGVMDPSFEIGAQQADQILNWIAEKEWSDGKIGMFGDSWQAMIQFAAASTGNQNLKAIMPVSSSLDSYSAVNYRGGVYNETFNVLFSESTSSLEFMATPVDADADGALLAEARAGRSGATVGEKSAEVLLKYPFHDSTTPKGQNVWEGDFALYPFINRINEADVPIYMTNGWYDLFTGDMFLWYANLTVPRRIITRPLDHNKVEENAFDLDFGAEAHRWFDYWLKGIDNGIMDEPPIFYYTIGAPKESAWQSSTTWPLTNQQMAQFYFSEGRSGSISSVNDGKLVASPPTLLNAADVYKVSYLTTSGEHTRWGAVLSDSEYPNMQANDEKALTYTTAPLESSVEITGHPSAHIWLQTTSPVLDVFVYLEEVDTKGNSTYITEGNLRASHRALSAAPYDTLGLPFHNFSEDALESIPSGQPFELVLDLLPTSYQFQEGNRIRITIAFADNNNFDTPIVDPAPGVSVLRNPDYPSYVVLPVISKP